MKTAVEWLEEQTRKPEWHSLKRQDIFEQAKKMEQDQIIDFAYEIADELAYDVYSKNVIEDIFKKTFKSK
jgi:hypothetical protein